MTVKKGLFSIQNKIINEINPVTEFNGRTFDNSIGALKQRAADRAVIPELPLKIVYKSIDRKNSKTREYDFSEIVEKYPHHKSLINNLLVGAKNIVPNGMALNTAKAVYQGIREFTEFLNSDSNLSNTKVVNVCDINITICKSFSTWLSSKFPGRTVNRKNYSGVNRCIINLWDFYPGHPLIGTKFNMPKGPNSNEKGKQGYSVAQMLLLMTACKKDIAEVKLHHIRYQAINEDSERYRQEDINLENVMFYIHQKVKNTKTQTTEAILRHRIRKRKRWIKFINDNGYSITDLVEIYNKQGSELTQLGRDVFRSSPDNDFNLPNFMYWLSGAMKRNNPKSIHTIIRQTIMHSGGKLKGPTDFSRIGNWAYNNGFNLNDLVDIYCTQGVELAAKGANPFVTQISQLPDKKRFNQQFDMAMASLKYEYPQFPTKMSFGDSSKFLPTKYRSYSNPLSCISLMLSSKSQEYGFWGGGLQAFYEAKHFTSRTLYPFFLLALINSGWNQSSLLDICEDVDSHTVEDIIDPENYIVLTSYKSKTDTPVRHRCNKKNPFGTYQLLKYVEKIISDHNDAPEFIAGCLWQCIALDMSAATSVFRKLENDNIGFNTRKSFLTRHKLTDSFYASVDHMAVRNGYSSIREAMGATEFEVGDDLDQKSVDSVLFYTSDIQSAEIKNKLISNFQKQFISDLRNLKTRLVQSKTLQDLRDAINNAKDVATRSKLIKDISKELSLDEKDVAQIISIGSEKYLAICLDQNSPDWPGHEHFVTGNAKCKYFNKCCLCSKSLIFREFLPFIALRILHLENSKYEFSGMDWTFNFGDEYDAWNEILSLWNNKTAVEEAWESARKGEIYLPHVMRGM